jgi:predicted ATPase
VVDVETFAEEARRAWQSDDPAIASRAANLYTGELLPEDPYEDWAASRREGLRASYLTLLTRLAELHETSGDLSQAIAVRERILQTDPLDETAHQALMRLHVQLGNKDLALGQYARLQTLLDRELGTTPNNETEHLAAAIRVGRMTAPSHPPPVLPQPPPNAGAFVQSARLPGPAGDLVGRERELAELDRLLAVARLVTLTGAGGIGKTRLAVEAARARSAHYPDGITFVDLASLRDPALVLTTIARAAGVDEAGARPIKELVASAIGERRMLLVLDNLEHLTSVAEDVAGLLSVCPQLSVLTTSRVRLRLRGEHEYPVLPLAVPARGSAGRQASLTELSSVAAIELFARRAAASRPGFALTALNVEAVAEICQRLDGLPLAIELAAAQVRALTPAQVLRRLDRPLDILGTTASDVPSRQRTLRETIAWSHDLLSPEEQVLFRRLAVFAGGWSLEGTEAIAGMDGGEPINALQTLGRLIDHSLVETRPTLEGAELRYSMLETIREFAVERLQAAGELLATEDALESFLLELVARAEHGLRGPKQLQWLDRLDVEHDNIRAVLGRSLMREPGTFALHLAMHLWRFWLMRGYPAEGRNWIERSLEHADNAPVTWRAKGRHALGHLAIELGNYAEADEHFAASLALCQQVNDNLCRADALSGLGVVALNRQRYSEARSLLEEAHEIRRELGDEYGVAWSLYYLAIVAREWGEFGLAGKLFREALTMWRQQGNTERIGLTLVGLGMVSRFEGDARSARPLLEEALNVLERISHRYGIAVSHMQLGHIARLQGDERQAMHHYVESLAGAKDLGANEMAVEDIEFVACVATALGQPETAGRLFGAAAALRLAFELPPPMDTEVVTLEQHKARAQREALNEWAGAWSTGQAMSLDQAIAEARALLATESDAVPTRLGAAPK